jgi:hypothetical protein
MNADAERRGTTGAGLFASAQCRNRKGLQNRIHHFVPPWIIAVSCGFSIKSRVHVGEKSLW